MKSLNFKKIDAFTKGISSGNPAGYVLMEKDNLLSVREMQKIAAELKGFVNEVGYVYREGNDFFLKYYSSECEVAFCGHATIAIMYDLISNGPDLIQEAELSIHVGAGTLPVINRIREEDAVYITAPKPEFLERSIPIEAVAKALGTEPTAFDTNKPQEVVDGGLRTLIIPITCLEVCLALKPDQETLRQFCLDYDFDIVHVSTEETAMDAHRYRTRVFAPKYGYLEDPATGSGNSAFGYYLLKHGRWIDDFSVEQGPSRDNPNSVKIKQREMEGTNRILFGGAATTRIEGQYCLHDHE